MGANPVQDPMPAGGMYLAQDGNIVVGATIRKADNDDNMYYMKIDPVSLQPVPGWGPISYGGPGNEVLTTIAPSPTGGIIMGGAFSVTWPGNTESQSMIVRTNAQGVVQPKTWAWLDALLGLK